VGAKTERLRVATGGMTESPITGTNVLRESAVTGGVTTTGVDIVGANVVVLRTAMGGVISVPIIAEGAKVLRESA